jgi:2-polyprenyl-3-methyl-5-hydroxy-6-metoxy-1,4-benzoquinol methylase
LNYWDRNIDWNNIGNCLELGARKGGLSLWLALKGENIICSDLSNTFEKASVLHKKYNIIKYITYQDINVLDIPYENYFDIIIFKSIIGSVGNFNSQQKAFCEIHKALKSGGKLLFADNLAASSLHQFLRKKFVEWGNSCRYVTLCEMETF